MNRVFNNAGFAIRSIVLCALFVAAGCTPPRSELAVDNVHTVTQGVLIRGAQTDEVGLVALRRAYGIRTVVNFNDRTADAERTLADRLGLNYVALPASPFHPDPGQIIHFLKVIDDPASRPVYVHCKDGMDRTGYAVAAYRVLVDDWAADKAIDEVHSFQTWPHRLLFAEIPAFIRAVKSDEASWRAQLSQPTPTLRPEVTTEPAPISSRFPEPEDAS